MSEILHYSDARSLDDVEVLVRSLANKIIDLKGLGVDLMEENSAALLLLSKIVNEKLPRAFLVELSRVTNSTYPDFNQLFNLYQSIVARLRLIGT